MFIWRIAVWRIAVVVRTWVWVDSLDESVQTYRTQNVGLTAFLQHLKDSVEIKPANSLVGCFRGQDDLTKLPHISDRLDRYR